jgi:hypothetical protein
VAQPPATVPDVEGLWLTPVADYLGRSLEPTPR